MFENNPYVSVHKLKPGESKVADEEIRGRFDSEREYLQFALATVQQSIDTMPSAIPNIAMNRKERWALQFMHFSNKRYAKRLRKALAKLATP